MSKYQKLKEDLDALEITEDQFTTYEQRFDELAEGRKVEDVISAWKCAEACGCMGPVDGEPLCGCRMRYAIADLLEKIEEKDNETR